MNKIYLKNLFKVLSILFLIHFNIVYAKLKLINKIVAIVEDSIILESDVEEKIQYMKIYEKNFSKKNFHYQWIEALNQIITDNIIFQSASRMNILVTDNQINQSINNFLKKNNINKKRFCSFLKRNLIDYNIYFCQIKKKMILSAVFNKEICQKIFILPQEIESLSNQFDTQNFNTAKLCVDQFFLSKSKFNQKIFEKIKLLNCSYLHKNIDIKNKKTSIFKFFTLNNFIVQKKCIWKNINNLPLIFTIHIKDMKNGNIIGPIFRKNGLYIFLVENINWNNIFDNIKFHIQHLFIKDTFIFKNHSKKKIKYILEKIKMGKISFNDAARNFSKNINTSMFGGNIGWIEITDINKHFLNIIKNLKLNEISCPFHYSNGWYIIKILDVYLENRNLSSIKKNVVSQFLFNKKSYMEIINWIEKQKRDFYIKIF